jgi:hypothetical protein
MMARRESLSTMERFIMKSSFFLLGAAVVFLVVGCASTPVALGPVGPNPFRGRSATATGHLQVFTRLDARQDDQNQAGDGIPVWYAHTDYDIYNLRGKLVKYVGNTPGHYAEGPTDVALPSGRYLVAARARDYLRVKVMVTIDPGRTTRVHLDDNWTPAPTAPKRELVTAPNGNPVGWHVNS